MPKKPRPVLAWRRRKALAESPPFNTEVHDRVMDKLTALALAQQAAKLSGPQPDPERPQ